MDERHGDVENEMQRDCLHYYRRFHYFLCFNYFYLMTLAIVLSAAFPVENVHRKPILAPPLIHLV